MYAIVRKFEGMRSIDEAGRRAAEGLGGMLRQSPGFIAYFVVRFGPDTGGSITLFESREAAQEAHDQAMDWIRANLADLIPGEPEVFTGEVLAAVTNAGTGRTAA